MRRPAGTWHRKWLTHVRLGGPLVVHRPFARPVSPYIHTFIADPVPEDGDVIPPHYDTMHPNQIGEHSTDNTDNTDAYGRLLTSINLHDS